VLFTIRTYDAPLAAVLAEKGRAADLRATLATVGPEHADYKGWRPWLGSLLADLEALAA
jgi:hypothetical protein